MPKRNSTASARNAVAELSEKLSPSFTPLESWKIRGWFLIQKQFFPSFPSQECTWIIATLETRRRKRSFCRIRHGKSNPEFFCLNISKPYTSETTDGILRKEESGAVDFCSGILAN
jgi:hypothetical protein